jgi:predicted deacylase
VFIYPRQTLVSTACYGLNTIYRIYKFVETGDEVKKGQKLGEIRDIFGNLLEEITAVFDGRIKISNNTLGVSKGDDTFMYGNTRESD